MIRNFASTLLAASFSLVVALTPISTPAAAPAKACVIYGQGHKVVMTSYTTNVKVYRNGQLYQTYPKPGTYWVGHALASEYTCGK